MEEEEKRLMEFREREARRNQVLFKKVQMANFTPLWHDFISPRSDFRCLIQNL